MMLALSHQRDAPHKNQSTSPISAPARQSDESNLSMSAMAEAEFARSSGASDSQAAQQAACVEWTEPSDNVKLDRRPCRESMNDAAGVVVAAAAARQLGKRAASSIFKSLPTMTSETEPVEVGGKQLQHHHRQPSSDIFLRMSGDNHQHKHQEPEQKQQQREKQHHNKHNNQLPFVVVAREWARGKLAPATCASGHTAAATDATGTRKTRSIFASSFKIPSSSSSSSSMLLLLALISHIVIISLILHQSPANNQAFAWSASHQPQQHQLHHELQSKHPHRDTSSRQADHSREQRYTKSDGFSSLAAPAAGAREVAPQYDDNDETSPADSLFDRMILDGAGATIREGARERQRRHLADGVSWNSHRSAAVLKRHQQQQPQPQQQHAAEIDCQKLTVFWAFLQTSYPALSSHLFQWATELNGRSASDEQFLWSKSSGSARSIGHLLQEAERLVAGRQQRQSAPGIWLQRISSNPAYARLIQHLRSSVNKMHKSAASPRSSTTTTSTPPPPPPLLADELTGSDGPQADGEQIMASPTHQQQKAHYGRVVHYPHEIGNTDNSNGMARTLDKLRLLSQHARQQQQRQTPLHSQDEPAQPPTLDLSDIESNRILSTQQQDVDLHSQQQQRQSGNTGESVDSARNNFVYGKVLLKPQHANDFDSSDSANTRRDPLSTLRELASEQQRQLLGSAASGAHQHPRSPDSHYGRIIMSPPSSEEEEAHRDDESRSGTLNADDNRNERAQHLFTADYAQRSASFDGLGPDELSNQQKSQRVAITADQNEDEEFEGVFHAGPLKEIEVRQLRSTDHKKQKHEAGPDVELVTSTESPQTVITSTAEHLLLSKQIQTDTHSHNI